MQASLSTEQQDELNTRAEAFAKEFSDKDYEMGHAQNFVRELCGVYGLNYLRAVDFEHRVKQASGKGSKRVDAFFAGLLLVEMKSKGEDLEKAYQQALEYLPLLKRVEDHPKHILVSDFHNLHLYDVSGQTQPIRFKLSDFKAHVLDLDFLLGYERIYQQRHEAASKAAAEKLGNLHDAIKATGYQGADLQTLLVRLLFCLFADDTHIFEVENAFQDLVQASNANGDDLGGKLHTLFRRLDDNPEKQGGVRTDGPYAHLKNFPYVNGALFSQRIEQCDFDADSRKALLECCELDWSEISPDIFGTLFQHIMHWDDELASSNRGKTKKRRDFGAHYTSERNIQRAIAPLFLDELKDQLQSAKGDKKALATFADKLALLNILDPACGCGNFLVVAYREIRWLEQQALDDLNQIKGSQKRMPQCDVHQFHGIEIDPTAVEIATVALWLTDHQMNQRWAGSYKRIPLKRKANIVEGNALRTDWSQVIPAKQCSYIVGNPPFLGKQFQNTEQKADMEALFTKVKGAGVLDYVAGWYVKALPMLQANPALTVAFVSTNSITQGEQVAVLWQPLIQAGIHLHFAHRTFKWSNDGSGVAAVHCVIIGFGLEKPKKCTIWDYSADIKGEGRKLRAKRINPYLVDAPLVALKNRKKTIFPVPEMSFGNMPNDGGNLLLSEEERKILCKLEPNAKTWIVPFLGAEEFINNIPRFCLWLTKMEASELKNLPEINRRVKAIQSLRNASSRNNTQALASTPHLFGEIRQPEKGQYLLLPRVSSERRNFVPIGFLSAKTIASDATLIIPNATLYHFGMLSSTMHNAWLRAVGGRLKSDYRYSASIVYNNYPWPHKPSKAQLAEIETAAQAVLDARAVHEGREGYSLAWAYNPETMPKNLQDAHDDLDAAIDEAYGYEGANDDANRVAFLFTLYQQATTLLHEDEENDETAKQGKKSAAKTQKVRHANVKSRA